MSAYEPEDTGKGIGKGTSPSMASDEGRDDEEGTVMGKGKGKGRYYYEVAYSLNDAPFGRIQIRRAEKGKGKGKELFVRSPDGFIPTTVLF